MIGVWKESIPTETVSSINISNTPTIAHDKYNIVNKSYDVDYSVPYNIDTSSTFLKESTNSTPCL
jgi:hypothetical protein